MKTASCSTRTIAIKLAVCMLMLIGLALVPVRTAKGIENLPRVTEEDLRGGKINGTNWMSGISGELYLHQINIPGSHDSGMRDSVVRFESGLGSGLTKWATTQSLGIDEQLRAGVRLFDLRLTELYPINGDDGKASLWICHGPNGAGRFESFT